MLTVENHMVVGNSDDWLVGSPVSYCDRCGRPIYEDDLYIANAKETYCIRCESEEDES